MKKNRSLFSASEAMTGVLRRALLGGAALLALTALAGLLAFLTRDEAPVKEPQSGASSSPAKPSPTAASPSRGGAEQDNSESNRPPPKTSDPVKFGKAAAEAVWAYDTRSTSHKEHMSGLKEWMTDEGQHADWPSVRKLLPDAALWKRMADNKQRASATASEGRFPQAFQEAMANEPGAITKAYVYVVTVHGKQKLSWTGSGAGAEARSVTLAVQCRPDTSCALAGVMPQVLP